MNSFRSIVAARRSPVWPLGLALLCILAFWSFQARAEIAANVHFVSGLVTATASGQPERELAKDSEIYDSDQIDTAYNGRVQMRFTDGGLVSLMPNTTFSVEEYRLGAGDGEDGALVFGLLRGGLRTVTGAIGKTQHDNYQLKTPVGTLGIRGTEFIVVIGPPGTMRVHVGRGKVVITNSHGTLEVPEGGNAIITIDTAPMLTEEGPVFLAMSPIGDRGAPQGMVREDPYGVELPLGDLVAGGSVAPMPPVIPTILPSGPGYMAVYPGPGTAGMIGNAVFDPDGTLVSFDGLAGPTPPIGIVGAEHSVPLGLSWGTFNNPSFDFGSMPYAPYVIGQAIPLPTSGSLSYSLVGGVIPDVYDPLGGIVGSLTQFDLVIGNLASTPTFGLSMNVDIGSTPNAFVVNNATGNLNPPGAGNGFSFSSNPGDVTGGYCVGTCSVDVSGFITGNGGAGVSYGIDNGNSDIYSGVAPLQP